jgi:tRNA A37 threonylcarbamoyladenosine synthetase subunit TsaC/SUA5/YrdC
VQVGACTAITVNTEDAKLSVSVSELSSTVTVHDTIWRRTSPLSTNFCLRVRVRTQYTLILPASKNLPTQVVDVMKGRKIHRKSVGVRMPDDHVTQVGVCVGLWKCG